ncbi:MAG: ATP-binding protein [Anaerolineaceae bacterium]|nr:ATP-binding protein [Anaerolineaceae bacterium]
MQLATSKTETKLLPMITKSFPGNYRSLAKISEFYRQASIQAGFGMKTQYQIETAIDEACSNIIEHAYQGEGVGDILCSYAINNNELRIILEDQGQPFNSDLVSIPDTSAPLHERQNNGLGIYFMRKLMDEVEFVRVNDNNILTMVKYLEN